MWWPIIFHRKPLLNTTYIIKTHQIYHRHSSKPLAHLILRTLRRQQQRFVRSMSTSPPPLSWELQPCESVFNQLGVCFGSFNCLHMNSSTLSLHLCAHICFPVYIRDAQWHCEHSSCTKGKSTKGGTLASANSHFNPSPVAASTHPLFLPPSIRSPIPCQLVEGGARMVQMWRKTWTGRGDTTARETEIHIPLLTLFIVQNLLDKLLHTCTQTSILRNNGVPSDDLTCCVNGCGIHVCVFASGDKENQWTTSYIWDSEWICSRTINCGSWQSVRLLFSFSEWRWRNQWGPERQSGRSMPTWFWVPVFIPSPLSLS